MSRVLLCTFGSLGDIHPTLALAHELKRRGHQPVIATSTLYREKIENDGIEFHGVAPELPPPRESRALIAKVMDGQRGSEYLFRKLLMPALRDSYRDILSAARTCDLLISHPATPAAPLVAEKLGMRWMSQALAPVSLWSVHDPPVLDGVPAFLQSANLRRSVRVQSVLKRLAQRITLRWIEPYQSLRAELDLLTGNHPIFAGQHSPHGVLALFPSVLARPQPDWPRKVTQCGACFYDRRGVMREMSAEYSGAALHPELAQWLDAGEAPIVFTLGSAAVFAARDFYEQSTYAAQRLGRRALLLIGDETNRPKSLPENNTQIAAFEYAPYGKVFARAAAIVHQGGAGTTAQVLRSGAPSLVMPFSHDQPDHAARLQSLGVARVIQRRQYSPTRVARELSLLFSDDNYAHHAREISEFVKSENGPQTAVDAMEKLLHT